MRSSDPLSGIRGIGPQTALKYAAAGIMTIGDLLAYYPRRYDDYSNVIPISELRPGMVSLKASIASIKGRYVRRGMHITEAVASDEKDSVRLVWFNQPYRAQAIKHDREYFISGNYELSRGRFAIMNPGMELVDDMPVHTARIVPVYRESKGLTSLAIRRALKDVVQRVDISETLPAWLRRQADLPPYRDAVLGIHFPETKQQLDAARHRLGFEEVFELSLAALLNKHELLQDVSLAIPFDEQVARMFVAKLPFTLTDAQRSVIWRIYQDMERTQPMNRLVEGDVGSGKTVVAAMAAVMAMASGYQIALMAPTELLARQHADTIYTLLEPLGLHTKVVLLVGGMKQAQKETAYQRIADGSALFIIGTHAIIQEKVAMQRLGLVIIDEQHRFGVDQRKTLMAKAGHMPHLLSLTATPIPRSLALTLYGELDVSIIGSKPAGRKPVVTVICSPNSREQLNADIEAELAKGRQMFVVCPLISESGTKKGSSVEDIYERMAKRDFKHRRVGLLHGKMKPADKQGVMNSFMHHDLDILVSTTVIEVGVDVPNASIMLIESAERFGLAQIHQLRGRIGRGGHEGFCYLMMGDSSAPPQRLLALERINDGFKLAELDLELRGPGAIYGTMQHGALDLRIAQLTDINLINSARQAAQDFIDHGDDLLQYEQLYKRVMALRAVTNLN